MHKTLIYLLIILTLSSADIYLSKQTYFPLKASTLIILLIFMVYVILLFTKKTPTKMKSLGNDEKNIFKYFIILSIIFIVFSALPAAYSPIDYYPFLPLFSAVYFLFVFKVGGLLNSREISILIFSSFLVLFVTTIIDLYFPASFSLLTTRSAGVAENPNSSALRMILIGIVAIHLLNKEFKIKLFLIILAFGILSTLSRGGLILLIVVFLAVYINKYNKQITVSLFEGTRRVIFGTIAVIAVLFTLQEASHYSYLFPAFNNSTSIKRINMLLNKSDFIPKNETRLSVAEEYIILIQNSPFWGYGTGHSYNRRETYNESTHMMFLTLLIDFGVVGVFVYFLIIYYSLKYFIKSNNFFGVLFCTIWFLGSFYTNTILTSRTLWGSLALLLVINDKNKKQTSSNRRNK